MEAQWRKTPPLCFSTHAIAVYLGALEAPKDEPTTAKKQPDDFHLDLDNDEIDADDPDFVDFLQKLGSAGL